MGKIIIGYSNKKGYEIIDTGGHDKNTLQQVSKNAFPKGQNWGQAEFIGLEILKCFLIDHKRFAVSKVCVTDKSDEFGRTGIMQAEIEIYGKDFYQSFLNTQISLLPTEILKMGKRWTQKTPFLSFLVFRILGLLIPTQIVINAPINFLANRINNAYVFFLAKKLASEGGNHVVEFSTFSLNHKGESYITAVPPQRTPTTLPLLPLSISIFPLELRIILN